MINNTNYICQPNDAIVLILSYAYTPVGIAPAREGIKKLVSASRHAKPNVLSIASTGEPLSWDRWIDLNQCHFYDNQPMLRTASRLFPVPTIMLTSAKWGYRVKNERLPRISVLYRHYKGKCQICGQHKPMGDMSIEHIHPRSKGGTNDSHNITLSCKSCNSRKSDIFPFLNHQGEELKGYNPSPYTTIPDIRPEWRPFAFK